MAFFSGLKMAAKHAKNIFGDLEHKGAALKHEVKLDQVEGAIDWDHGPLHRRHHAVENLRAEPFNARIVYAPNEKHAGKANHQHRQQQAL